MNIFKRKKKEEPKKKIELTQVVELRGDGNWHETFWVYGYSISCSNTQGEANDVFNKTLKEKGITKKSSIIRTEYI